jgi:two-component system OmpR family sensor kinase
VRVCRIDGGRVRIEVADQGPGVAPEDAERIFEPFFRTDLARVRDTGGTGLGLSIVASIAQAHGGLVGVDPNDGGGALFWVEFPADVDIPQRERRHLFELK